jgi:leucyl aminopeptidase
VGKGITFDSGGLSLKAPNAMVGMKYDMTGAAVMAAATLAASALGSTTSITTYLCLAENMPSGSASRPNDVITIKGGKTVEILNTDAEGRLVMADGLALASELSPGPHHRYRHAHRSGTHCPGRELCRADGNPGGCC